MPGVIEIKPTVDVLLVTDLRDCDAEAPSSFSASHGMLGKTSQRFAIFHTLVDIFYGVQETTSQSELNRSSITKLLKIGKLAFLVGLGVVVSWVTQYAGQALGRQPLQDIFPKKFVLTLADVWCRGTTCPVQARRKDTGRFRSSQVLSIKI
jgi:hypothetical protein